MFLYICCCIWTRLLDRQRACVERIRALQLRIKADFLWGFHVNILILLGPIYLVVPHHEIMLPFFDLNIVCLIREEGNGNWKIMFKMSILPATANHNEWNTNDSWNPTWIARLDACLVGWLAIHYLVNGIRASMKMQNVYKKWFWLPVHIDDCLNAHWISHHGQLISHKAYSSIEICFLFFCYCIAKHPFPLVILLCVHIGNIFKNFESEKIWNTKHEIWEPKRNFMCKIRWRNRGITNKMISWYRFVYGIETFWTSYGNCANTKFQ